MLSLPKTFHSCVFECFLLIYISTILISLKFWHQAIWFVICGNVFITVNVSVATHPFNITNHQNTAVTESTFKLSISVLAPGASLVSLSNRQHNRIHLILLIHICAMLHCRTRFAFVLILFYNVLHSIISCSVNLL